MFLAVDVGNSQSAFALMESSGKVRAHWRCQSDPKETTDELALRIDGYLRLRGFGPADVDACAVASVVPALERSWFRALSRLGAPPCVIRPTMTSNVTVAIPDPASLGADRLANAVAAVSAYGAPVLVVDFGTATNIDVVDAKGRFVGGVISPGLMLGAEALFAHAAKLANVAVTCPEHVIGATSEEALQSGLVIGAAAQAEGLVSRIQAELECEDCPVVATGGLARSVSLATSCFTAIDPDLTLRGIMQLANQELAHQSMGPRSARTIPIR